MELNDLYEARRNPEVNIKMNLDFTKYYSGRYYVSFTTLPKIGINPKPEWTTPHGVCAYPLFIPQVHNYVERGSFPFAGDRPYANILASRGNELMLSTITDSDVDAMISKIEEKFGLGVEARMLIDDSYWGSGVRQRNGTVAGFWGLTNFYGMILYEGAEVFAKRDDIRALRREVMMLEGSRQVSASWNKALRILGYDLITDDVGGIIHTMEPYQTIFVNPKGLVIVDRQVNPLRERKEIVKRPSQLEYYIDKYKTSPISLADSALRSHYTRLTRKHEVFVEPSESMGALLGRIANQKSDFHDISQLVFAFAYRVVESPVKQQFLLAFIDKATNIEEKRWLLDRLSESGDEEVAKASWVDALRKRVG